MKAGPHGLLLVDKPRGRTSHDVVGMARRALGTRRVGHAGTLDPMATGLLVLAVGEGLKVLRYLSADDKRYAAEIQLGAETDTLDAEGSITARCEVPAGLDREAVEHAARAFLGRIQQRAPAVSALKRAGEPLHVRVRRGEVVEAPIREVTVHGLDIASVQAGSIRLQIHCGKGFYVRSLARDLGRALGTLGYLGSLRRLASGSHRVEEAAAPEALQAALRDEPGSRQALARRVRPLPAALPAPLLTLDAAGIEDARHGRPILLGRVLAGPLPAEPSEPLWLVDAAGTPVALARFDGERLAVVRGVG